MGLDALEMQSLTCPATQSRCLVCWARLGYLKVALEKKTGGLPRSPSLSRCFFAGRGLMPLKCSLSLALLLSPGVFSTGPGMATLKWHWRRKRVVSTTLQRFPAAFFFVRGLDALEVQSLICPAAQSRCVLCWARHGDLKVALEKRTGGLPRCTSLSRCFSAGRGLMPLRCSFSLALLLSPGVFSLPGQAWRP